MSADQRLRAVQDEPRADPADSPPDESAWSKLRKQASTMHLAICCHGETAAPSQRQFQFRHLSDDPRMNQRLALTPTQGIG
jgi:hypothetical protein